MRRRLMYVVLAAFVAPEEAVRQKAAATVGSDRFLLIHLSAPIDVCRQRDTEGQGYQRTHSRRSRTRTNSRTRRVHIELRA